MSHLSKIFEEAPIKVQNRNGFDLSHVHSGSSKCGQLVPVLTKLLAPNTTISLGVDAEVNLPPIVAPFFGKIDFAIEGFVVPCSILYGGWKQFISNNEETQFPLTQSDLNVGFSGRTITESNTSKIGYSKPADKRGYALPYFNLLNVSTNGVAGWTSLSAANNNIYDYMGLNVNVSTTSSTTAKFPVSLLPAIAYHKIVDTFYRNTKLTRTWFAVNPNVGSNTATNYSAAEAQRSIGFNQKNVSLIWHSFYANISTDTGWEPGSVSPEFSTNDQLVFPDNVSVFSTRQRTYMRDYFTSALYDPQQGGSSALKFSVDTSDQSGSFTISSLRMANALQKFLETNSLSGDYAEMVRNRWGVRPIDADFEEPHYLGRVVIPVYQHTVFKQDSDSTSDPLDGKTNPYVKDGLLGASAGVARANGEGSICDNFNVSCWSYLMCLASLYPHANYNYGINRELTMTKLGDFPAPELQTVGAEEIKNYELSAAVNDASYNDWISTFGYTQRYSRFKYMDDHTSGELRPGKTLNQYQLQRSFSGIPQLGTNFVEIGQSDLDGVLAVNTNIMNLSCWWEIYFKLKVVMPLADYCIPTLGELQDTHTIKTTQGGSRL